MKGKMVAQRGEMARDASPSDVYAGKGSNVIREASKKKRGGKTVAMHGDKAGHRLDRPARMNGGKVGSSPFSAARNVKSPAGRDVEPGCS